MFSDILRQELSSTVKMGPSHKIILTFLAKKYYQMG